MIGLFDSGEGGKRMREPLAARMRPRNLDEFVGQEQIVGPGARCAVRSSPIKRRR